MNPSELETWILKQYDGLVVTNAYRERSFFYNPSGSLPKGIYFCTIKKSDGPNDKAANLNREGVFRLSLRIGKKKYTELFGDTPPRPAKGGIVALDIDFTLLNELTPHPVYAWMGWVCINCPSEERMPLMKELLDLSYIQVTRKYARKNRKA